MIALPFIDFLPNWEVEGQVSLDSGMLGFVTLTIYSTSLYCMCFIISAMFYGLLGFSLVPCHILIPLPSTNDQ